MFEPVVTNSGVDSLELDSEVVAPRARMGSRSGARSDHIDDTRRLCGDKEQQNCQL